MAKEPIEYEIKLDVSRAIKELKRLKWEAKGVKRAISWYNPTTMYFVGVIVGVISTLFAAYILYK